jgi:hypothetical protein
MNEALQRITKFMRENAVGFISLKQGDGERLEEDKDNSASHERKNNMDMLFCTSN